MFPLSVGQVVISKCGRDKDYPFIVLSITQTKEGEYVTLADGALHTLEKPKKKKAKHIQPVNLISQELKEMLETGQYMNDAHIRKALDAFYLAGEPVRGQR